MVAGSRPANVIGKDHGPSGRRRGSDVPVKPGNSGGGKGPPPRSPRVDVVPGTTPRASSSRLLALASGVFAKKGRRGD